MNYFIDRINFESIKQFLNKKTNVDYSDLEMFLKFDYRYYLKHRKSNKQNFMEEEEFDIIHLAYNSVFSYGKFSNFTIEEIEILERRNNYNFNDVKKLKLNDNHYNFYNSSLLSNTIENNNINTVDLGWEKIMKNKGRIRVKI